MLTFKLASHKDLYFLMRIRNENKESFLDNRVIDFMSHCNWFTSLSSNDYVYIIYVDDDRIGTISLIKNNGGATLGRFIIDKNYRNKGFGTMAIEEFKSLCKMHNLSYICLEVKSDNTEAISLYKKCGFETVNDCDNTIIMRIDI